MLSRPDGKHLGKKLMVVANELKRAADILQGEKDDTITIFNEEAKSLGKR